MSKVDSTYFSQVLRRMDKDIVLSEVITMVGFQERVLAQLLEGLKDVKASIDGIKGEMTENTKESKRLNEHMTDLEDRVIYIEQLISNTKNMYDE